MYTSQNAQNRLKTGLVRKGHIFDPRDQNTYLIRVVFLYGRPDVVENSQSKLHQGLQPVASGQPLHPNNTGICDKNNSQTNLTQTFKLINIIIMD